MNKAIFLDRDGVINRPIVRNKRPFSPMKFQDFYIYKNSIEALKKFYSMGYYLFVITNQPEIARGNLKLSMLNKMHQYLLKKTNIKKIYFCPHDKFDNCYCRKPKPGMILNAIEDYNIDINKSYLIGDRKNDIDAANHIKLKSFFIDREYEEEKPKKYIRKVKNLYEVLNFIQI